MIMERKLPNGKGATSYAPISNFVSGGVRVDTFAEIIYVPLLPDLPALGTSDKAGNNDFSKPDEMLEDLRKNKPLLYDEMFGR